jgi:hypothetical protein
MAQGMNHRKRARRGRALWAGALLAALTPAAGAPQAAAQQADGQGYDPRLPRVVVDMPEPTSRGAPSARATLPPPESRTPASRTPDPETPVSDGPEARAPAPQPGAAQAPDGRAGAETRQAGAAGGFDLGTAVDRPEGEPDAARPAWRRHALPFDDPAGRPRIAVVIDGVGLSQDLTAMAIDRLPAAVTLAVAAHAPDPAAVAAAARTDGHEVLMTVPMEPLTYPHDDPGPDTLLTTLAPQNNLMRLERLLGDAEGHVGAVNAMGSRFTASPESLRPVLRRLEESGLLFVERHAAERSAGARIGREVGLPYARSDRVLAADLAPRTLALRLIELEHIARDRGHALAIAEPTPMTIDRLAEWIASLPDKGLVLAPVTAVAATDPSL